MKKEAGIVNVRTLLLQKRMNALQAANDAPAVTRTSKRRKVSSASAAATTTTAAPAHDEGAACRGGDAAVGGSASAAKQLLQELEVDSRTRYSEYATFMQVLVKQEDGASDFVSDFRFRHSLLSRV